MWHLVYDFELPNELPDGVPVKVYQGYIEHFISRKRITIEDEQEAFQVCEDLNASPRWEE